MTINGLKVQRFTARAIDIEANSDGALIENNEIAFMTAPPPGDAAAVVGIVNFESRNVTISHNYLHDLASEAIICTAFAPGTSIDGTLITGNVALNTVLRSNDNGVIACSDRSTGVRGGHVTIADNFIRDYGSVNYNHFG